MIVEKKSSDNASHNNFVTQVADYVLINPMKVEDIGTNYVYTISRKFIASNLLETDPVDVTFSVVAGYCQTHAVASLTLSTSSIPSTIPEKVVINYTTNSENKNLFRIVNEPNTWDMARQLCIGVGSNLATVLSADSDYIINNVQTATDSPTITDHWIGLRREAVGN